MASAMMWRALVALALLASGATANAAEPQILSITITDEAAKSVYQGANCSDRRIDEKRVRYFLRHAKLSIEYNYMKGLVIGNCSASTIVRYRNAPPMNLTIDDGTGWGLGVQNKRVKYLYCEECEYLMDSDFDFK